MGSPLVDCFDGAWRSRIHIIAVQELAHHRSGRRNSRRAPFSCKLGSWNARNRHSSTVSRTYDGTVVASSQFRSPRLSAIVLKRSTSTILMHLEHEDCTESPLVDCFLFLEAQSADFSARSIPVENRLPQSNTLRRSTHCALVQSFPELTRNALDDVLIGIQITNLICS